MSILMLKMHSTRGPTRVCTYSQFRAQTRKSIYKSIWGIPPSPEDNYTNGEVKKALFWHCCPLFSVPCLAPRSTRSCGGEGGTDLARGRKEVGKNLTKIKTCNSWVHRVQQIFLVIFCGIATNRGRICGGEE